MARLQGNYFHNGENERSSDFYIEETREVMFLVPSLKPCYVLYRNKLVFILLYCPITSLKWRGIIETPTTKYKSFVSGYCIVSLASRLKRWWCHSVQKLSIGDRMLLRLFNAEFTF